MSGKDFVARWVEEAKSIPERVLPWERTSLPPFPDNPTEETVADYVKKVSPYLHRGRWWFRLMFLGRSFKHVWMTRLGKILVVSLVVLLQQIYTHVYIQILQERAAQIGSTLSSYQVPYWISDPWTANRELNYRLAKQEQIVDWYIRGHHIKWTVDKAFLKRLVDVKFEDDPPVFIGLDIYNLERFESHMQRSEKMYDEIVDTTVRAKSIGWKVSYPGPPYLDSPSFQQLRKEVLESEELHPKVVEIETRTQAIDWPVSLDKQPYNREQVEMILKQLAISEPLHSKAVELNARMEKMNWQKRLQPPYTEEMIALVEQEVEQSEPLFDTITKLIAQAGVMGWDVQSDPLVTPPYTQQNTNRLKEQIRQIKVLSPRVASLLRGAKNLDWSLSLSLPYQEEEIQRLEESLQAMQQLQSRVKRLQRNAQKIELSIRLFPPYTEEDVLKQERIYQQHQESHPRGVEIVSKLRRRDVKANISPPYAPEEVSGAYSCYRASEVFQEYGKRGEDCACVYGSFSRFEKISCEEYGFNHPEVRGSLEKLKRMGVHSYSVSSQSMFSQKDISLLKSCASVASSKKTSAMYDCVCNDNWGRFDNITCRQNGSTDKVVLK